MSLLFCDSFESYDQSDKNNTLWRTWIPGGGGANISSSEAKTGSQSLAVSYNNYASYVLPSPAQNARLYVGFAYKPTSLQNSAIIQFGSTTTEAHVSMHTSGLLGVYRHSSTLLGMGTHAIQPNVWNYIEVKMTITNSTSFGDVIVRINGITDIELGSGIDTCYQTAALQYIYLNAYINHTAYYDDLYICDDLGTVNNTFLGECVVEYLRPSGNGATSDWDGSDGNQVDNYLLVDDQYVDDSDYVEGQNLNEIDLYEVQNLSIGALTIRGIRVAGALGRSSIGQRYAKQICRSNGVNYEGAEQALPSGGFGIYSDIWETDPDTGVLWQEGAIGNLQVGAKISA